MQLTTAMPMDVKNLIIPNPHLGRPRDASSAGFALHKFLTNYRKITDFTRPANSLANTPKLSHFWRNFYLLLPGRIDELDWPVVCSIG